jgi:hypothetical protein
MALQEMQALLPMPQNAAAAAAAAAEAKSPESAAAQSSNSKAAKVEAAIDYIKQLKQEVSERDRLLDSKDAEMEMMRKELAALRGSSSESGGEVSGGMKTEPSSSPDAGSGSSGT